MTSTELEIRFGTRRVGGLSAETSGTYRFAYDASWVDADDSFPISVSLPLRTAEYVGGAAHWYFANLLPEGEARQAVCDRLGLSIGNDLALLRAIGGECAGALAICEPDAPVARTDQHSYEMLADARLQTLVTRDIVPLLVGGPTTRLSLAGAQPKLPIAMLDDRVHLALEGAPSTHILKLPHLRFAHLCLNEAYVMGLAAQIGFDVASVDLLSRTDPPSLLVERFDRRASHEEWPVTRLHQEDFCQALSLAPVQKYEQEGGPSLVAAIELVSQHAKEPFVDVRRLIEWQAFNVVVGNCDGHGKNLSFLYEGASLRLAPFYDLLSTRQYEGLDRRLAMSVGGRRDPAELHRAQWEALAREARLGTSIVIDAVRAVAERCADTTTAWTKEYRERYGRRAILQTLPAWITKSARKVLRNVPG
jgi:serine/threonine-protein kinase HipA